MGADLQPRRLRGARVFSVRLFGRLDGYLDVEIMRLHIFLVRHSRLRGNDGGEGFSPTLHGHKTLYAAFL